MNDNQQQYVKDVLDTFENIKAYQATLFLSLFFGVFGIFFAVIMWEDVMTYLSVYTTYQAFFGLSIFCMIGGLGSLYVLWKHKQLENRDSKQMIHHIPIAFLTMIPGFIMLMYVSLVEGSQMALPISYISFYLCIYAIIACIGFYILTRVKIFSEKEIYQKRTLRYVEGTALVVFSLIFIITLFLRGSGLADIPKIILITIIVTFFAYQAARTFLASQIMKKMDIEYVDYDRFYHDGTLGDVDKSYKARVMIINDGYIDKALDVLEEFRFDRNQCMNAIIKRVPFYTFDEKMYYDIRFMKYLLMRLAYENIPFQVEVYNGKQWVIDDSYQDIEKRRYVYQKKEVVENKEEELQEKNGLLFNIVMTIITVIGFIIYGIWAAIFPVNYFKPIRWCSFEQAQKYYNEMTYFSVRTFYHLIWIWILFIVMVLFQPIQVFISQLMEAEPIILKIIFVGMFIIELFHFPSYLKRLKTITNQDQAQHNYEKKAFLLFVVYSIVRSILRGWQKSLCMLIFMIIAIELAKSIHIFIRYFRYRKETKIIKENEEYEFVEDYHIEAIAKRMNQYKSSVIRLKYSDEPIDRYSSQIGGTPYWLKGEDYPHSQGEPLYLLAQINLDELNGESIESYPNQGMLQFFIQLDDMYGCDFDDETQSSYRVVYHEKVDYDSSHLQDIDYQWDLEESPIMKPTRLQLFVEEEIGICPMDHQFMQRVQQLCADLLLDDFIHNDRIIDAIYNEGIHMEENKISGQGSFAQEDPRSDDSTLILLQLVSDDEHMMWGDYGMCHFFIQKDDLKKKNFDNVVYTWDCY